MKKSIVLWCLTLFISSSIWSQKLTPETIKTQIETYKNDIRGPYKDIRWFCTDGSIRQPKDPCPDNIGPGWQHARYKDAVENLGKSNHVFLGQILANSDKEAFWDADHNHSRLKQYQIDKYLRLVDDGWIMKKGQFYRGAIQAEDEQAWGIEFYRWLLSNDSSLEKNFFLIRQSLKDIPYSEDDNISQLMRSQSKVISDEFTQFMDLRVKIHSQPEQSDIEKVKAFRQKYNAQLSTELQKQFDGLLSTMAKFYKPANLIDMSAKAKLIAITPFGVRLKSFAEKHQNQSNPSVLITDAAELLFDVRQAVLEEKRPMARLQLLDISLKLESLIFKNAPEWQPENIEGLLNKICYLGMATAGAGYIEAHEWDDINLSVPQQDSMTLEALTYMLENARSIVEWSSSMVKANYQDVVNEYTAFEPKTYGFIDDKIRGSIALYLGMSVGELGDIIAQESQLTNKVMNIANQSSVRGLNPGYAYGELVVVPESPDHIEVNSDNIYIFQRPPADLKPIAGIATVSEGNLVSHVQLLARNLGIPNAALSDANLNDLKPYHGQKVFYAVSNKGNVILKPEVEMTDEERSLFVVKERKEDKIEVPVEQIRLDETNILNMRDVDASDSGKLCGPKAANLGQLKKMFPDNVVEGLVIPFGIFRTHMDQRMPDTQGSYWEFLNAMFARADEMRDNNITEAEVENYQLRELEVLRNAIKSMYLSPEFVKQLEDEFETVLGKPLGEIPVFLRSDTNMEDLKDFTGAGLNLTLFNVVDKAKVIQGIKDVWASPYTERSFKWRQKYLLNPENVFPSILIIPSVDVDYSGVLITKGITSGNENDLTIAFSRGAGGAVDGQSAETYLLKSDGGLRFLAPAREMYYNSLPETGGTAKQLASFEKPILNNQNLNAIRALSKSIKARVAKETNSDYEGAYDVELGFKDNKLWLFQIRPFVENKKAVSSNYLESISPKIDQTKSISLSKKL
jgi:hypothetical protein